MQESCPREGNRIHGATRRPELRHRQSESTMEVAAAETEVPPATRNIESRGGEESSAREPPEYEKKAMRLRLPELRKMTISQI